ncbi:hypothetical protein LOK49_LG10G01558 [Camellia lanceoleosa]|uniref:Uncharacterized protein n=1 Tax=Camellia lanceoleosa TaxID=1840588 RepID=A0ACC0G9H1_9ERIC|nr:hypothetical protein LOK49_LG10G01558 [Camellia lanceoleosa]
MDNFKGITTTLCIFWLITLSHEIVTTVGDGHQSNVEDKEQKPSATEVVRDIYALITRSTVSSWDKVKSFINEMQTQFVPPDLDFRKRYGDKFESGGGGEKMKEAAQKSFETSKVTVEESAKSAAKVMGEAMHKTTKKVRETVSDADNDSHDEL